MEEVKPLFIPEPFKPEIFKEQFLLLLTELKIRHCKDFVADIKDCDDAKDLRSCFGRWGEDIAEELGAYTNHTCQECESKDDEISDLEDQVADLEKKVEPPSDNSEYEGSLFYQLKMRAIFQNIHRFSVDEIEQMFNQRTKISA